MRDDLILSLKASKVIILPPPAPIEGALILKVVTVIILIVGISFIMARRETRNMLRNMPAAPMSKPPVIEVNNDTHKLRTCCCCCACCNHRVPVSELDVLGGNRCCDHNCTATLHKVDTEKEKVTK